MKLHLCSALLLFFRLSFCAETSIKGIDEIYLINLDHRPDRLAATQSALAKYRVSATRFSAVNGRELPLETLLNIALPCPPDSIHGRWMTTPSEDGTLSYTFLTKRAPFQPPIFCEWMTIGAVGCATSHISVLREAYEKGHETIWVMEDDILIKKNPKSLARLIRELDGITKGEWDILYTDTDNVDVKAQTSEVYWWMWRPDLAPEGDARFSYRREAGANFVHIASRDRTHSMIIRRSGMKKLLDHFENNHLFLPIDHEIAFAPGIILYMLSYPVVTYNPSGDTDIQIMEPTIYEDDDCTNWRVCTEQVLNNSALFPGWCTAEKTEYLMNFIRKHGPALCVEIGAFGGSTSYPIASALKFLDHGHLYSIDAWNNEEAVRGLLPDDPNYTWWSTVDLDAVKNCFSIELINTKLTSFCSVMQSTSLMAANDFADNSIDFLYVDGNFSATGSLEDVYAYYPKVKPGGYILVNDANAASKRGSIAYLMEVSTFIPQQSFRNLCAVFQKT